MGMNYYIKADTCPCCNKKLGKDLHIGKSSHGWYFLLHAIPEQNINNLGDWVDRMKGEEIINEKGEVVSMEEMIKIIKERTNISFPMPRLNNMRDYAEIGLHNLLRYKINDVYCLSHGDGPWSMISGEFS